MIRCTLLLFAFFAMAPVANAVQFAAAGYDLDFSAARVATGKELRWESGLSLPVRMARGESEGVLFFVDPGANGALTVEFDAKEGDGITLQVFRAEEVLVEGGGAVPDALVPLDVDGVADIFKKELIYLRVSASKGARPGRLTLPLRFSAAHGQAQPAVVLDIEVLSWTMPETISITIQAGVWPFGQWSGDGARRLAAKKSLLKLLADARFNAVAGLTEKNVEPGRTGADDPLLNEYRELLRYALDDLKFKRARLPVWKMYTWKKPLSREDLGGKTARDYLTDSLRQYFALFAHVLDEPKWRGKISYKLWDEPHERDYADVVESYRVVRSLNPKVALELSEQPIAGLEGVVDIWTPYISYLRPEDVVEQHRLGKQVWVYANKVHEIGQRPVGMRILGWLIWKYDLDGYLFWAVNWWKEDPWHTVSSWKADWMKSGVLTYPSPSGGEVYGSLRLEAFREGIEDLLMLRAMEPIAGGTDARGMQARDLLDKGRAQYGLAERYEGAADPASLREQMVSVLANGAAARAADNPGRGE